MHSFGAKHLGELGDIFYWGKFGSHLPDERKPHAWQLFISELFHLKGKGKKKKKNLSVSSNEMKYRTAL